MKYFISLIILSTVASAAFAETVLKAVSQEGAQTEFSKAVQAGATVSYQLKGDLLLLTVTSSSQSQTLSAKAIPLPGDNEDCLDVSGLVFKENSFNILTGVLTTRSPDSTCQLKGSATAIELFSSKTISEQSLSSFKVEDKTLEAPSKIDLPIREDVSETMAQVFSTKSAAGFASFSIAPYKDASNEYIKEGFVDFKNSKWSELIIYKVSGIAYKATLTEYSDLSDLPLKRSEMDEILHPETNSTNVPYAH